MVMGGPVEVGGGRRDLEGLTIIVEGLILRWYEARRRIGIRV
jgi:hypothetical protein